MTIFLIALTILGIAVLLPPLLTKVTEVEGRSRSAWRLVLETPALLVPAVVAGLSTWGLLELSNVHPTENPFTYRWPNGILAAKNFLLVATMSAWVAGFLGLLEAIRNDQKPDGAYFWKGIKDHSLTIFLAKLATFGILIAIQRSPSIERPVSSLLMLAPSLLLAPILGTTALHPRRPFRAFRAALQRSRWDMQHTARLLVAQILVLFGLWSLCRNSARRALEEIDILAQEATVMSFNPFPFFRVDQYSHGGEEVGYGMFALSLITSSVFVLLHHQRVMNVPNRG